MAADGRRHVLAIGGMGRPGPPGSGLPALLAHALSLAGQDSPRLCMVATASGDDPGPALRLYPLLSAAGVMASHLSLFPMPNAADPESLLMSQDVVFVGGGSVANLAAVWRVHGLDAILCRGWRSGVVLAGVSAGAICWFEGGTTDSFGPDLRAFTGGLGLLAGSYCPHYDSEPERLLVFQSLVGAGALRPGIACDDGAAAHFVDDDLHEVVTDRPEAGAYLVQPRPGGGRAAETRLGTRPLAAR